MKTISVEKSQGKKGFKKNQDETNWIEKKTLNEKTQHEKKL